MFGWKKKEEGNRKDEKSFLNKKGFSGVDITAAIAIIILGMAIIYGVMREITLLSAKLERKSEALRIGKSIYETIKVLDYDSDFAQINNRTNYELGTDFFGVTIPKGYKVKIKKDFIVPANEHDAIEDMASYRGKIVITYVVFAKTEQIKIPFVKSINRLSPVNKPDLTGKGYTPIIGGGENPAVDFESWQNYDFKTSIIRKAKDNNNAEYTWKPAMIRDSSNKLHYLYSNKKKEYAYKDAPLTKTYNINDTNYTYKFRYPELKNITGTLLQPEGQKGKWEK